jgi:PKD repeat protein
MTFAPEADLIAELIALTPEVAEDGTALFKLTIYNNGPSDADGVTITPSPGAGWINPVVAPAGALYVPAGGHTEVFISAKADAAQVAPGDTLDNAATVNLAYDPVPSNNTDTATVTVVDALPVADVEVVSISLAGGGPIVPGNSYTFNITARNNGPASAYGAVLAFSFLNANYIHENDTAPAGWSYAMDPGVFLATAPMADGAEQSFSLTVRVPPNAHYVAPYPFDFADATIAAANPDPNIANNYKRVDFNAQLEATLNIEKTLLNKKPAPGEFALWEIVVCNDGPSDVDGIGVVDIPGLNLNANTLELSSDADDLYIPAGQCVDVMARAKVKSSSDETEDFCNTAEVDDANVDPGATTLAPIVNEPSVTHCWDVGRPDTFWYGRVDYRNECNDGAGWFFADCDGNGLDEQDVAVYVDGVRVPVLALSPKGYVLLEQDYGIYADVTIDYCWWDWKLIEGEFWQWINIETHPDHYTEFVLPEIDDKPALVAAAAGVDLGKYETGDYILVSSFITQDSDELWPGHGSKRVKFAFDPAVGKVNSADVYVNDAAYNEHFYGVAENSLRLYGRGSEDAGYDWAWWDDDPFWATHYDKMNAPFDIAGDEAPDKDFLVWNPAYFNHNDYPEIWVDGDANQKVFLKQWYVPYLEEPLGEVWDWQEGQPSADIVKEYTYLLLDVDNNPIHGRPNPTAFSTFDPNDEAFTAFKFPVADWDAQLGLDSFDVDNDGDADRVVYDSHRWSGHWGDQEPAVLLRTDQIEVQEGDVIRFLDHMVTIKKIDAGWFPDEGAIAVETYYEGLRAGYDQLIDQNEVVRERQILNAGRHLVDVDWDDWGDPVRKPWLLKVEAVVGGGAEGDFAYITLGRWLQEDESFFVDGLEYYISKLGLVEVCDADWCWWELKYISIRNPLCKDMPLVTGDETVTLQTLSVIKTCIPPMENLPFLPPFNMDHDIIDDVDIAAADALSNVPDEQLFDTTDIELRVLSEVPVVEYYIDETKEPRFDTNLLEEKFTYECHDDHCWEEWRWINIETKPWHYTEFVLPEIQDVAGSNGDYILVSSWLTEDSESVDHGYGAVRMKFSYDAADEGLGIYVNTLGDFEACVEAAIVSMTADPMAQQLGEAITFSAEATGTALTYMWDFGDGNTATGAEADHTYSSTGSFIVTLTVEGACGDPVEETLTVEVVDCEPVDLISLESDSPRYLSQSVTVTADVEGDAPITYAWDFPDATLLSGGQATGEFQYAAVGTYMVTLTVSNECLSATDTMSVEVEIITIPGDVDEDCDVDIFDIMAVVNAWLTEDLDYDLDGDGDVDILDIMFVVVRFGDTCPS